MEEFFLTAARLAPSWVMALVIVIVGAIFVLLWRKGLLGLAARATWTYFRSLKPTETTLNPDGSHKEGTGAPPMPVQPDGTIHLDQEPPKDNL